MAAIVAMWRRIRSYKLVVFVILILIILQYFYSNFIIKQLSIRTFFTDNASRRHHRELIIHDLTTSSSYLVNTTSRKTTRMPKFSYANNTNASALQLCPLEPPKLVGPLKVETSPPEFAEMEKILVNVMPGGIGSPSNCIPRSRVAIIVPFRDREQHLRTLLYHLHPILLRQQIEYQIFIVEQAGDGKFNRATLMNVGYVEALKEKQFDCFVFHDVDHLPEDDRNLYTCPEQPRHMSVAVDIYNYELPYEQMFGGVSALTREHFRLVNGFSNAYWGWGGEDDDLAKRIKAHGLKITRSPANIARYKMLTHKKAKPNPERYKILNSGNKRLATDGLSNLQYELLDKKKWKLYTWLLIRLTPPKPNGWFDWIG